MENDSFLKPMEIKQLHRVYNKRHNDAPIEAVYVGRPTKYGNRYTHLKSKTLAGVVVDTLEQSLACYLKDLLTTWQDYDSFHAFITPLIGKDLVCWCAPPGGLPMQIKPSVCHAQILGALVAIHASLDAAQKTALSALNNPFLLPTV